MAIISALSILLLCALYSAARHRSYRLNAESAAHDANQLFIYIVKLKLLSNNIRRCEISKYRRQCYLLYGAEGRSSGYHNPTLAEKQMSSEISKISILRKNINII